MEKLFTLGYLFVTALNPTEKNMGIVSTIILVLCVIVCVIILLLVLLQNEEGNGMGGLLGGSSGSAFGARSASVLAKITRGAVCIFFVLVLALGLLNRSRNSSFEDEVRQQQQQQSTEWWKETAEEVESTLEDLGTQVEEAIDSTLNTEPTEAGN